MATRFSILKPWRLLFGKVVVVTDGQNKVRFKGNYEVMAVEFLRLLQEKEYAASVLLLAPGRIEKALRATNFKVDFGAKTDESMKDRELIESYYKENIDAGMPVWDAFPSSRMQFISQLIDIRPPEVVSSGELSHEDASKRSQWCPGCKVLFKVQNPITRHCLRCRGEGYIDCCIDAITQLCRSCSLDDIQTSSKGP